jgi:hypothetical protein
MAVDGQTHSKSVKIHRFQYVLRLPWTFPTSKIHRIWASLTKFRSASDHKKTPYDSRDPSISGEYLFITSRSLSGSDGLRFVASDGNTQTHAESEEKPRTTSEGTQTVLKAVDILRLENQHAGSSRPPFPPPPPPPPLPLSSNPVCQRCQRNCKVQPELARLRTELLTLRARVQNESGVLAQMREFALKAQENVIEAVNKAIERGTLVEDQAEIRGLQQEVMRLNRDLHDQSDHYKDLQRRLSTLDYRFGQKEDELYGKADFTTSKFQDADSVSVSSSESSETSETNAPTLVRDYYDCVGTMDATWHTLQEIEENHREELNERERNDHDSHHSKPSEKQFIKAFFEDRATAVEKYLKAQARAKRLRAQCLDLNYYLRDDGIMDTPPLGTYSTARPLELLLFRPSEPEERLLSWLEDVLREQAAASYRFPRWTGQNAIPQSYQQVHPELKTRDPETLTATKMPSSFATQAGLAASSRGLSNSPMYTHWPGEILLQRRYSNPDLPSKQHLAPHANSNHAPRSTC